MIQPRKSKAGSSPTHWLGTEKTVSCHSLSKASWKVVLPKLRSQESPRAQLVLMEPSISLLTLSQWHWNLMSIQTISKLTSLSLPASIKRPSLSLDLVTATGVVSGPLSSTDLQPSLLLLRQVSQVWPKMKMSPWPLTWPKSRQLVRTTCTFQSVQISCSQWRPSQPYKSQLTECSEDVDFSTAISIFSLRKHQRF